MNEKGEEIDNEDGFLSILANLAELGYESSITLQIGGSLVSGQLISQGKWQQMFSELFRSGFSAKDEKFGEIVSNAFKPCDAKRELKEIMACRPAILHLRDARVYLDQSGELLHTQSVLWRGKVSSVDGFFLGSLERSKA
jgi:hypothetical protein